MGTNQAITSLLQEEINSKSPMEQMQRAQKTAKVAKEAWETEKEWGLSLQSQADAIAAKQEASKYRELKLEDASEQAAVLASAASLKHHQTLATQAQTAGVAPEAERTPHDPALLDKFGLTLESITKMDEYQAERNKTRQP